MPENDEDDPPPPILEAVQVQPDYAHLLRLVSMLEADGNVVCEGGFRPNQGGVECRMTQPIDFSVVATFAADDRPQVEAVTTNDMVWCSHCWAAILGPHYIPEVVAGHR